MSSLTNFNTSIKLLDKYEGIIDFNSQGSFKDFKINKLKKLCPQYLELINFMERFSSPDYKYNTIDLKVHYFKPGDKTCKDTSLHYDGDLQNPNLYHIMVLGQNPTFFAAKEINLPLTIDRFKNHKLINELDLPLTEIPRNTVVQYTSFNLHKGRTIQSEGPRILIRLCSSNYLKPKNHIIKRI